MLNNETKYRLLLAAQLEFNAEYEIITIDNEYHIEVSL